MYLGGVICLLNIRYDKNSVVCIFEGYCFILKCLLGIYLNVTFVFGFVIEKVCGFFFF